MSVKGTHTLLKCLKGSDSNSLYNIILPKDKLTGDIKIGEAAAVEL